MDTTPRKPRASGNTGRSRTLDPGEQSVTSQPPNPYGLKQAELEAMLINNTWKLGSGGVCWCSRQIRDLRWGRAQNKAVVSNVRLLHQIESKELHFLEFRMWLCKDQKL